MSEPALSLAFFDRERELHGSMREGVAVLFERDAGRTLAGPAEMGREDERFSASCGDELALSFTPISPPVDLGGSHARVCRVGGRAFGATIDCLLGTLWMTTVRKEPNASPNAAATTARITTTARFYAGPKAPALSCC